MRGRGEAADWSRHTRRMLEAALAEDVGARDLTTERVVPARAVGRARVVAREPGVLAGGGVAAWIFERMERRLAIRRPIREGERFAAGDTVLEVAGRVGPILTGERVALNLLAHLSGVATLTREYVDAVAGTGALIVDTRKTTPGWRELERAAVRAGGGTNHRFGLYDAILIKENHVRAAGGVAPAWRRAGRAGARAALAARRPAFAEIEVRNLRELDEALEAGARMILLDNFAPAGLARAVRRARRRAPDVVLEASGGVTLATVRAVAESGVDRISIGALTHSARALDLSLLLEERRRAVGRGRRTRVA
ncbi:MAG TPA: carboxylating nicotinate-nucleotide diphosphorylase [Gemmatimonadota bacterium]